MKIAENETKLNVKILALLRNNTWHMFSVMNHTQQVS